MNTSTHHPEVTIVTPAYNAAKFLPACIDSALAQEFSDWEMLIAVDAKSSDDTLEIASDYANQDARIRVISEPTLLHVAQNRNACISRGRGRYIAFLDADDIWYGGKLSKQIDYMKTHNLAMCFHDLDVIDDLGELIKSKRIVPNKISYHSLLQNNNTGCPSIMLDRHQYTVPIAFDAVQHEDYVLWLKLIKNNPSNAGLNLSLAAYRVHGKSRSSNKLKAASWRWNIYRKHERLSMVKSLYYFAAYAITAFRK